MKTIAAAIVLTALLSSCAALSTQYQHPVTKEMKKCESFGIGWLAYQSQSQSKKAVRKVCGTKDLPKSNRIQNP